MNNSQILFSDAKSEIDLSQLQELFSNGAFWAKERNIEDLTEAIKNSEPVIAVWNKQQLIGFARATSDGIYRATIWDVVIHPDIAAVLAQIFDLKPDRFFVDEGPFDFGEHAEV